MLKFPWKISPLQVIITPIRSDDKLIAEARKIKAELESQNIRVDLDLSDKKPGEKYYYWEMKGVPLRIELGNKELEEKKLTIFRRDKGEKESINAKDLLKYGSRIPRISRLRMRISTTLRPITMSMVSSREIR